MHVNPCPFSTIIMLTIRLELYNRIIILKHDSHKKRAFNVKAENFIAKLLFFHFKKKIMRIAYKRKLIYPVTIQVLKKKKVVNLYHKNCHVAIICHSIIYY